MATRDKYTRNIKCPKCCEEGEMHISEDDYAFMKNPHMSIDRIDGKFSASLEGEYHVVVVCKVCGERFKS